MRIRNNSNLLSLGLPSRSFRMQNYLYSYIIAMCTQEWSHHKKGDWFRSTIKLKQTRSSAWWGMGQTTVRRCAWRMCRCHWMIKKRVWLLTSLHTRYRTSPVSRCGSEKGDAHSPRPWEPSSTWHFMPCCSSQQFSYFIIQSPISRTISTYLLICGWSCLSSSPWTRPSPVRSLSNKAQT